MISLLLFHIKGIEIHGQVASSWGYLHECVRAWGGLFS